MEEKQLKRRRGDNGKWGYADENDNWIIEPKFVEADEFYRGIARVQYDWLWGFLKKDGSWLFEPVLHEADPFSEEIARVRKGFFYGFINRKGEWVIEPILRKADQFDRRKTISEISNLKKENALISNKGKLIIDFNPGGAVSIPQSMFDNRIPYQIGDKYGYLDQEGNWVIPPVYESITPFIQGRAFISTSKNSRNYDMIDLEGNVIMKSVDPVSDFKNGKAIVKVPIEIGERDIYQRYKAGVIDREGNWIIPPLYDDIGEFNKGFSIIIENGKKGVIDKNGNVIIPSLYKDIRQYSHHFNIKDDKKKVGLADINGKIIIQPKYEDCWIREDGFIILKNKGKYGLADLNGKTILKPTLDSMPGESEDSKSLSKDSLLASQLFEKVRDFSDGMAAIKKNDLWGFIDLQNNLSIEPQFDEVFDFKNGFSVVNVSNHWGLIDKKGEWLVEPKFDEIKEFSEGVAPAKIFNPKERASKWGFIDEKAQFVIKPEFDGLENFIDGFAKAKSKGKWGLVDKKGNWIVPPKYQEIDILNYKNVYALVEEDGLLGFIDRSGKVTVEPKYECIENFSDIGVARVKIKNKTGFVNYEGKENVPVQLTNIGVWYYSSAVWGKINNKWGFVDTANGRWIIEPIFEDKIETSGNPLFDVKINGKWGKIDTQGNWLINPLFDSYKTLSERVFDDYYRGFMHCKMNHKEGYYDVIANKWILPPKYEDIDYVGNGLFLIKKENKSALINAAGEIFTKKWYDTIWPSTKDGVFWIEEDGKYGVMDLEGNWLVPPTFDSFGFDYMKFNNEGVTRVKIGTKWGTVDKKGNVLAEIKYDVIYDYNNGYAAVKENGMNGLIDLKGNIIIKPAYKYVGSFYNGLALAENSENKYGFLDLNGNWAIKPQFDDAESFSKLLTKVKLNGKEGIINLKGDWIVEPKFNICGKINKVMPVYENGKYGYINLFGEWVVPPIYIKAKEFFTSYGEVLTTDGKKGYVDVEGKFYKRLSDF